MNFYTIDSCNEYVVSVILQDFRGPPGGMQGGMRGPPQGPPDNRGPPPGRMGSIGICYA